MAKDAHEDPYTIAGDPAVVLVCADCGELAEIGGTRRDLDAGQRYDVAPADALCVECYSVAERVWGKGGTSRVSLKQIGPPTMYADDDTGHRDPLRRRVCPRCNGTGIVLGGFCFACYGDRWCYVSTRSVRRVARWSQTFQQNRVPTPDTGAETRTTGAATETGNDEAPGDEPR